MKKYLIMLTGVGEGCDYSPMGCNKTYFEVEATNLNTMLEKVLKRFRPENIQAFHYVVLNEIAGIKTVNIEELKKEYKLYLSLHKKFGEC